MAAATLRRNARAIGDIPNPVPVESAGLRTGRLLKVAEASTHRSGGSLLIQINFGAMAAETVPVDAGQYAMRLRPQSPFHPRTRAKDMIRDLVVPMTATTGDEAALAAAISLAENAKVRLCAIEPVNLPMPMANAWGIAPEMAFADVCSKLREQGEINAAWLRGRLGREPIDWEVRIVESLAGEPSRNLAMHARYADISVMAAATGQEESVGARVAAYFNGLLFESGRPVLVIPPRHRMTFPISRAVIAWQPTREAARALHDALPLLLGAGKVDVLMIQPDESQGHHDQPMSADIADHLARHGLHVDVVKRRGPKEAVASMLLDHASQSGAQLLVAGGYGHSRLREWALGGTTRELLHATKVPVLFSH